MSQTFSWLSEILDNSQLGEQPILGLRSPLNGGYKGEI